MACTASLTGRACEVGTRPRAVDFDQALDRLQHLDRIQNHDSSSLQNIDEA
jgi:hypothetical protein